MEYQTYRSRAHLAEIAALLGPPPRALLKSGKSSHKFFTDQGKLDMPYKYLYALLFVTNGTFLPL